MLDEDILGAREIEHDDFSRYRQRYPGRRKSNHTWKRKLEGYALTARDARRHTGRAPP